MDLQDSVTVVTGSNRSHHEPPRTGNSSPSLEGGHKHVIEWTMHLRWRVLIVAVAAVAAATALAGQASAANRSHRHRTHHNHRGARHVRPNDTGNTGSATGLGQLSGLLPREKLTVESALQVDFDKESVRLPLYPGKAPDGTKVWYVLLDSSDSGLAHDLGINYAPKLANIGIGCPDGRAEGQARATRRPGRQPLRARRSWTSPASRTSARPASRLPAPTGSRWTSLQPGAVAGPGYSPFIRFEGSSVVYSAPIVAVGDGPFDVTHHTNTGDRVLGVHLAWPVGARPVLGVVG